MKLTAIHTGFLKLDGGAMFGIVPKTLWSKMNPPDEKNLCTWAMRCLLIESDDRKILVDTGIGNKQGEKWRSFFEPHGSQNLFDSLQTAGVRRTDITDILLTHLHFDHCGGAIFLNEEGLHEVSFPNAVYWSTERHWQWAVHPNERERASFLQENFNPLLDEGRIQYIKEPTDQEDLEWLPGIRLRFVFGHTEAMMLPIVSTEKATIAYCADLMPSSFHIGMPYVMAYDVRPLLTLAEKHRLLLDVLQNNWTLMFEHDPVSECATLTADESGRMHIGEKITLQAAVTS